MMNEPSELVSSLITPEPTPAPAQEPEGEPPAPVSIQAEEPAPTEPSSPEDPPAPKPASKSLKEYALAKGLDLSELYDLELSSGETLSSLSNKGKSLKQLDVDTTAHAGEVAKFRADQLTFNQAVQDWAELVQAGENTPQALANLNQHRAEQAKAKEVQLLAAIPEWADLTAKTADQQRIDAFAGRFGLPPGTAENITEPGVALMMKYVLTLEDNFQSALQKVERAKNKAPKAPGKSPSKTSTVEGLNPAAAALLKAL